MPSRDTFQFRLERVLDLRRRAEEVAARALADAERQCREAEARHQALVEEEAAARTRRDESARAGIVVAGDWQSIQRLAEQVTRHRETAARLLAAAEDTVAQARQAVLEAARARQALEKLRDRQEVAFRETVSRRDQQLMDEVARLRWSAAGPFLASDDRTAAGGTRSAEMRGPGIRATPPEDTGLGAGPGVTPAHEPALDDRAPPARVGAGAPTAPLRLDDAGPGDGPGARDVWSPAARLAASAARATGHPASSGPGVLPPNAAAALAAASPSRDAGRLDIVLPAGTTRAGATPGVSTPTTPAATPTPSAGSVAFDHLASSTATGTSAAADRGSDIAAPMASSPVPGAEGGVPAATAGATTEGHGGGSLSLAPPVSDTPPGSQVGPVGGPPPDRSPDTPVRPRTPYDPPTPTTVERSA